MILLAAALLSGGMFALISLPIPTTNEVVPFDLEDGLSGVMTVTGPKFLRLGDKATLTLEIAFDDSQGEASSVSEKIIAKLQNYLLEVNPDGETTAVIPGNGTGIFRWRLIAHNAEKTKVTLWCFKNSAAGPELLLSKDIAFEVKTILEMKYRFARWVLGEIMLLSLILAGLTWFRLKRT